jgi:hypothetical protein
MARLLHLIIFPESTNIEGGGKMIGPNREFVYGFIQARD